MGKSTMKITIELEPALAKRLKRNLRRVEIPESEIESIALDSLVETFVTNTDETYIAEGYPYPNRENAERVARRILKKYFGQESLSLHYWAKGRVVKEAFANPFLKAPASELAAERT